MATSAETVAQIKGAAEDGIPVRAIARHHQVSASTVSRILRGAYGAHVQPAEDCPAISVRPSRRDLAEDAAVLLGRGLTLDQAAAELGVSPRTIRRAVAVQ